MFLSHLNYGDINQLPIVALSFPCHYTNVCLRMNHPNQCTYSTVQKT